MPNSYRVSGARPVLGIEPDGTLTADLTAAEERDLLASGRLELLPGSYRNIGTSVVHGAKPGASFRAALTVAQKAALVAGGHIAADDDKPAAEAGAKRRRPAATDPEE